MATMLSNIGTMAGLAAYFLFGEMSFAYTQLFATPQNVLMVVFAFPLAQYYRDRYLQQQSGARFHVDFRKMFLTPKQLGFVGMLVGLGLHWAGVTRPVVLAEAFPYLIHVRAWIALVPVGYKLNFVQASKYYRGILSMLPLKFVLVSAAAPSAINTVVTSTLFQLDVDLSVAAFLLTTGTYILVVVPLFYVYLLCGGPL